MAQAHVVLGEPNEALKAATRAAQLAPDDEWAHRLRSLALRLLRRHREAISAAAESVRLAPELAFTHLSLGEAQLISGNSQAAYAEAYEARRLDPGVADCYDLLGRCLLRQKKFADAEASFRYALQLEPDFAMAHNNLGVALQGQGRRVDAVHAFNAAAKLDPTSDTARKNVFAGTRALVGGGFIFVLVITVIRFGSVINAGRHLNLFGVVIGGLFLVLGVWWLIRNRPARARQLPQTALAYYRAEKRRLRPVVILRIGSIVLAVLMLILGLALQSAAVLLLALPSALLLYAFSPRIWQRLSQRSIR
jgi:tetratricopeptide (TPR) repeat protein